MEIKAIKKYLNDIILFENYLLNLINNTFSYK